MNEHKGTLEKAGMVIPKLLEDHDLLIPYKLHQAKVAWPQIAGKQIAKYSYIQKADSPTLVIAVLNSVWMNQLFMHKKLFIEKINAFINQSYVKDIQFVRSGKKPEAPTYETLQGEEQDELLVENLTDIVLPTEVVATIKRQTEGLPEALREKVERLRFTQEKRIIAHRAAGRAQCPYCGRFLHAKEEICYLCQLRIRQEKKKMLYAILVTMPWLTWDEVVAHQYVPGDETLYKELYNEIRRECIYKYIERIHHNCDTVEDDMMLALFITRKNPTEMTDAFIHNLTNKYRGKNDVSTHRRKSND